MPDIPTLEAQFAAMHAMCVRILALCAVIQRDMEAQHTALRRIQAHLEAHVSASR